MYLHLVAAKGIVAVRRTVAAFGFLAVVTRVAVVIEDDLLVQGAQIHYRPNTSLTFQMAAASASTSSRVLYRANEARAVAATP